MRRFRVVLVWTILIFDGSKADIANECRPCTPPPSQEPTPCGDQNPTATNHPTLHQHMLTTVPLGERGYNLAGDYDTIMSRIPLFNMSIKHLTECVRFRDMDNRDRSFRPSANFHSYEYYSNPPSPRVSFKFIHDKPTTTVWESYMDFRKASSVVLQDSSSINYQDLFVTLNNIGAGKQPTFQGYYKKVQRLMLDKRVPFYHLRAQTIHGKFELKKFNLSDDGAGTHFSTAFRNYVQTHFQLSPNDHYYDSNPTTSARKSASTTSNGGAWDEKFFTYFGTHYVRRGLFGGYIDLMISPWDILCELKVRTDVNQLANCITEKLNRKFGLVNEKNYAPMDNRRDRTNSSSCSQLSSWVQNDQDFMSVVSGSDLDYQLAMSIGTRYPTYEDPSDKPLINGWLHSLYDTPGLVEAEMVPICELFPNGSKLHTVCKENLLAYMKNNEPLLRTEGNDEFWDELCHGKRVVIDVGYNSLRDGCVSTLNTNVCGASSDESGEAAVGSASGSTQRFTSVSVIISLVIVGLRGLWEF